MPLDVCAAAYYIKNTNISYEDYLNVIDKPNVDFEKLQSTFLKEGINYDNSRYAILASTFEKIIKVNISFKKLLLLICLLDSQNIPISYLERSTDHVTAQKFLYELRRFSLITEKGSTFSLHRSTQSVGQKYIFSILSKEERELMIDDIVKIMTPYKRIVGYLFDEKDKTGWFTIKEAVELLPHTNTLRRNILHLKVKNWHKYSVRLKMTEFLGKEYYAPRLTLRKIANEILEENHNYFSDDELAILVLERAYCIYGNISDCSDEDLLVASFNKSSYEGMKSALAIYLARINLEKGNQTRWRFWLDKAKKMANTVVMRGVVFEDLSAQIRDNCIFGKEVESALQYGCKILSESEIDINLLPKNRYPFYIVNTYVRQMMLANADNDTEKAEEFIC